LKTCLALLGESVKWNAGGGNRVLGFNEAELRAGWGAAARSAEGYFHQSVDAVRPPTRHRRVDRNRGAIVRP
jgi:hypothetical protein